MKDWLSGLHDLNGRGEPAALVTVVETRGSSPREPGAKMTVGQNDVWDTVGGGQLEHAIIESARLMLEQGEDVYANTVERHALSASHGQCCGGVARVLLERIPSRPQAWIDALLDARQARHAALIVTPLGSSQCDKRVVGDPGELSGPARARAKHARDTGEPVYDGEAGWFVDLVKPTDFHIALFGAGHVGTALAGVLATLPCDLTWVDSRAGQVPAQTDPNVRTRSVRYPEELVDECPPGSYFLVMTHSHPVDFAICERVLERGDFAYCGMIGSQSKRRNLEKRLKQKGITDSDLNRLTCPIGVEGISGKRPAEIAVAVAAQILMVRDFGSAPPV